MKRFVPAVYLIFLLLVSCRATPVEAPPRAPTTAPTKIVLSAAKAEEISVEQLMLLLPKHPVVVGFDVDDTLIDSTPAFSALQPWYDPEVIRPPDYSTLSPAQRAKYHEFWTKLNDEFDERSTPKKIAKRLLDLHLARGDEIWIISKRQSSSSGLDRCTPRYQKMFRVKFAHPVVQTQLKDKTPFIAERKIEYYYGDSDSDIAAAIGAGAVPIRVKRGANSYAKDIPHNGQLGEVVLKGSEE